MESFYIVCERAVPNWIPNCFLECLEWKDGTQGQSRNAAGGDRWETKQDDELQDWIWPSSKMSSDLPFSKRSGKRALDFMDFSAMHP